MATKYVASFDYSDAELLALFREGVAKIAAGGQSYQIAGRMWTAGQLPAMWEMIDTLERRINSAATGGLATNIARLVRAS